MTLPKCGLLSCNGDSKCGVLHKYQHLFVSLPSGRVKTLPYSGVCGLYHLGGQRWELLGDRAGGGVGAGGVGAVDRGEGTVLQLGADGAALVDGSAVAGQESFIHGWCSLRVKNGAAWQLRLTL